MPLTRLLKRLQHPVFYDQCLQVINSVPVGIIVKPENMFTL